MSEKNKRTSAAACGIENSVNRTVSALGDPQVRDMLNGNGSKEKEQVYDMTSWKKDGSFSASPGQQVSREVYEEMYNCMPPLRLSREAVNRARTLGRIVLCGFMVGEPSSSDSQGVLYNAFGKEGEKYYYLGLAHEQKTKRRK